MLSQSYRKMLDQLLQRKTYKFNVAQALLDGAASEFGKSYDGDG